MKIRQLSVFLENRPGRLARACRTLADADISIITATLIDTKEFGILRLIVPDPAAGERVLVAAGYAVNVADVVGVEVLDRPGGLADVLAAMDTAGVNVEYCYAFTERRGDRAAVVFRFPDPDVAIAALTKMGVKVFSKVELFASK